MGVVRVDRGDRLGVLKVVLMHCSEYVDCERFWAFGGVATNDEDTPAVWRSYEELNYSGLVL